MEEMWFGDFNDADGETKAAESLAARVGELQGVLPFPVVAAKLISMANDPDHRTSDVADLIATDAGLSSRVLRVINSPSYSLRRECDSISHAVVLLGPNKIRGIAVGLSLVGMFKDKSGLGSEILEHSAVVAGVAERLGRAVPQLRQLDVYTCGLLHDIGKLFLLQVDSTYLPLLLSATSGRDRLHLAEREAYGYDHALLAAHVLRGWSFPESITGVVGLHHQPSRAYKHADSKAACIAVVRLADRIAHEFPTMLMSEDEALDVYCQDPDAVHLDLNRSDLQEIWTDLYQVSRLSRQSLAA